MYARLIAYYFQHVVNILIGDFPPNDMIQILDVLGIENVERAERESEIFMFETHEREKSVLMMKP